MKRIIAGIIFAAAVLLTAQTPKVLTNQDVLDMVSAKLSDSVILAAIHKSTCKFSTDPQDLIALKKAGVSDTVIQAMTETGSPTSSPAGTRGSQPGVSEPVPMSYGMPPGVAVTQDDVTYDGSTFKVTSMNGVPRSVMEMKPGGQYIASVIMLDGRIMTPMVRNDPSYANRIKAVLKIHAAGPAAANPPAALGGNPGAPMTAPTATAASAPAAGSGSGPASGNQQDLQGYEGSLGSLGDAHILLPGDSVSTPDGALKNAGGSTRVIVYFPGPAKRSLSHPSSRRITRMTWWCGPAISVRRGGLRTQRRLSGASRRRNIRST